VKQLSACCIFFLMILVFSPTLFASENDATKGFDKITLLIGTWQGTLPDGKPITVTYEPISGGAILEMYHSDDPMWWNMSTVYFRESQHIFMTHYCSWGNHPRMRARASRSSETVDVLKFDYVDMIQTQPTKGHMRDLTLEFNGNNKLYHHWIWREKGKDTSLSLMLTRHDMFVSRTH